MAANRSVGADLKVGPAHLLFDVLVALLDDTAQAIDPHDFPLESVLERGRLVTRYQVLLAGSRPGSVVAATSRVERSGP
jgi:hypothetical protein